MRREGEVGQVREGFGDRGEMIRGSTAVIPELHRRTCPVLTCKESSPLVLASRCSRMAKCVFAGWGNTERKIKCLWQSPKEPTLLLDTHQLKTVCLHSGLQDMAAIPQWSSALAWANAHRQNTQLTVKGTVVHVFGPRQNPHRQNSTPESFGFSQPSTMLLLMVLATGPL